MKKKKIIVTFAFILCGILIFGGIFMFFNRNGGANTFNEITDFESINLRFSGMRITEEYEILNKGENSEISHYYIKYTQGGEERELQKRAVCETKEVVDILNECSAGKWNGFQGKHPRGVMDGRMFTLEAKVNGGQKLYADGSENFPKNFNTFERFLNDKL